MGSNGGDEVMISGCGDAECPEATVEIKIKTLDSQTYTLRVDKRVPVPALKEQIATVTGVLSEQQRLICRGKVLKDDQLLSAYHVEDGHTLHLVVRQPITPLSESSVDRSATDPASSSGGSQGNRFASSVVVRTFNISEQRDGGFPDVNRIISAVLDSFGMTSTGSGSEGSDLREPTSERILRTPGLGVFRNSHSDQSSTRGQSNPHNSASPLPSAIRNESLQPPVIPDSLTTLSQYLSRMRHEFSANELEVRDQSSQAAGTRGTHRQDSDTTSQSAAGRGGLPTPASLAEVMLSTRQILMEQAVVYLSQLMRQLEDHANVTDPLARMSIQSDAMRSGVLLQNLGALLLELGRTTMTLRMGQTPADAIVNAGPAVFISTSGPNPIMVQPLPFQPGSSFGSIPMGTVQPSSGISSGSHGSGLLPRNIDIRIHTGSLMPSAVVNQRESSGGAQQFPRQTNPEASGSPSSTRESEVRVVPVRTVIAAVPAPGRRSLSDSSRGSVGFFYPVLARVQRAASGNLNGTRDSQPSDERNHGDLDAAVQEQNIGFPEADGSGMQNGEGITQNHSRLDQLLRTIFPGEHIHVDDANFQEMNADSTRGHGETTHNPPNTHEAAPRVNDDATFLSNLLRQIMPIISQSTAIGSTTESLEGADDDAEDRSTQVSSIHDQENSDRGNSSRRPCDPPSPPIPKRQKRE